MDSRQRFPAVTPQVGQVTENSCFEVSSLFFILTECDYTQTRVCTILNKTDRQSGPGT